MKFNLTSILYWCWLVILAYLMIDAVTSPLIRWSWGFYNIEILATIGLIMVTLIFRTYFNSVDCLNELKRIKDASGELEE